MISTWTLLDHLWVVAVTTAVVALLLPRSRSGSWGMALLYLLQLSLLGGMSLPEVVREASLQLTLLEYPMHWSMDGMGLYFSLITVAAALFASLYMAGEWGEHYRAQGKSLRMLHFSLAINNATMLLLLSSGDLLSLFIGWELASWSAFLMMALAGGVALKAAIRYLIYAMSGAMMIFAAISMIAVHLGTLQFDLVRESVTAFSEPQSGLLLLLVVCGFGIKMGLLPFHLWQAPAYAETPGPGSAFLGAISSRLGLFAMVVVLFKLSGGAWLNLEWLGVTPQTVLAWVAVATIIFPTFTAMRQNDARELLAWHGIGQGGYMLLGIVMMEPLGVAGGMLHVFNHATYQAALFFAVTAVIYRTGTSDLNQLGGLIVRMPLTFVTMLVGIIGLAGLPPMNGFVSKMLIYRSLLEQGELLLFVGAVIGTLGTILSVYKLIHNTFLGTLRLEHHAVKEVEWSMLLPMLLLSLVIFVTGVFPGVPLQWVAEAVAAVGLSMPDYHMGGVMTASGNFDMRVLTAILLGSFAIGALIFYRAGRSRRIHPFDNYAGGHFLHASNHYHYSNNFYAGLMHLILPWYRGLFQRMESALIRVVELLSDLSAGLFGSVRLVQTPLLIVVLLLWWGAGQ